MMKIKKYIPLLVAAVVLAPMFFANSCANTTEAPTGGKKDTIPPRIIGITPLPGAVNVPVSNAKIVFTFDEYVTIKEAKNIFLSPPQAKKPISKIVGKNLVIAFEEDLEPRTTYTLNMSDAIADNNESIMYPGFTYVFSTGDKIDSMFMTGTVRDCNTLAPVKGATVMLYKDRSDSAIFKSRPYAAAKTDDWGFFTLSYIADTCYRLYAIKDESSNNIYDPENDLVAFIDSSVTPRWKVDGKAPELLKYEPTDTLGAMERRVEHELALFREKPRKQFLKNKVRTSPRSAYVTFMAPGAWIDSLWIGGYRNDQVISQFNLLQDSLELWVNSRRTPPDTLHLFVKYRKTDSTGLFKSTLEHLRLFLEPDLKKTFSKTYRRDIKHEDTICVFTTKAEPETVERKGIEFEFKYPIISGAFDKMSFTYLNPKQKKFSASFKVERDSLNLRKFTVFPDVKYMVGYEYKLKVPHRAFRDINGFFSDSTEVKYSLPTSDDLSSIKLNLKGVDRKIIVELLDEKQSDVLNSYVTDKDGTLLFPYLKPGRYCVRVIDDGNRNSIVDTGSLLDHRQPEKVVFFKVKGKIMIPVPRSSELEQDVDLKELFR